MQGDTGCVLGMPSVSTMDALGEVVTHVGRAVRLVLQAGREEPEQSCVAGLSLDCERFWVRFGALGQLGGVCGWDWAVLQWQCCTGCQDQVLLPGIRAELQSEMLSSPFSWKRQEEMPHVRAVV